MKNFGGYRQIAVSVTALLGGGALLIATMQMTFAQAGRPDTRQMTCPAAQALVRQRGTIVLTTGPSTFDRFVSDARFCEPQSRSVRVKYAPTRDNPECPVGNRCYRNRNNR